MSLHSAECFKFKTWSTLLDPAISAGGKKIKNALKNISSICYQLPSLLLYYWFYQFCALWNGNLFYIYNIVLLTACFIMWLVCWEDVQCLLLPQIIFNIKKKVLISSDQDIFYFLAVSLTLYTKRQSEQNAVYCKFSVS